MTPSLLFEPPFNMPPDPNHFNGEYHVPHVPQALAFTSAYIRALWVAEHVQREMPKNKHFV